MTEDDLKKMNTDALEDAASGNTAMCLECGYYLGIYRGLHVCPKCGAKT